MPFSDIFNQLVGKNIFLDGNEYEIFELDFSLVRIASEIETEVEIQTDRVCNEFILAEYKSDKKNSSISKIELLFRRKRLSAGNLN
jgi:hypothetical protein